MKGLAVSTSLVTISICSTDSLREVSWIRHRDLHILTVGGYTYTSDQRFQATHAPHSDDWTLTVKWAQQRDAGVYECQVSTQPVSSFFVTLHVVGEFSLEAVVTRGAPTPPGRRSSVPFQLLERPITSCGPSNLAVIRAEEPSRPRVSVEWRPVRGRRVRRRRAVIALAQRPLFAFICIAGESGRRGAAGALRSDFDEIPAEFARRSPPPPAGAQTERTRRIGRRSRRGRAGPPPAPAVYAIALG
ncbi:Zwei Ig domain protein zig-8 [Eumeta japonica]|uniref:Zwei Ig domain protein zig-8 n=1 Tax=Eumeta variegata TaxID=151549 RepID=A0A4C1UG83_EUMVA|nr:Zwei Ig domain protein zig-8 [Eumeta japonica]